MYCFIAYKCWFIYIYIDLHKFVDIYLKFIYLFTNLVWAFRPLMSLENHFYLLVLILIGEF